MITLVAGLALLSFTAKVLAGPPNPQSGQVLVSAVVPLEPPTIDVPTTGQHFSSIPIEVNGRCQSGMIVSIFKNGSLAGSTSCQTDGTYKLNIDLFVGSNELVARQSSLAGQNSQDSNHVTVFYEPPAGSPVLPPPGGQGIPQLILRSDYAVKGTTVDQPLSWPVEILGSKGPYTLYWDWGDGTIDVVTRQEAGPLTLTHTYHQVGTYHLHLKATDSSGQVARLELTAIVTSPAGAFPVDRHLTDGGLLAIAWPIFIVLLLMLISFWLGERHEQWELEHEPRYA